MTSDRRTLRNTFELAAEKYHPARPSYPSALYDELVLTSGLRPGDSLLEIGGGSGKATVELARRGFTITSVELGHELAAIAHANVAPFPNAEVVCADFEHWEPAPGMTYDLVFAATSWHWIDPATRYIKAASLIRPGGHLALWSAQHVFPEGGDPIFRKIQPVYEEIGDGLPDTATWARPGDLADHRAEIEENGLFDSVVVRHFDWEVSYDVDGYLELLDTFSGHIAMAKWQREWLYSEIRRRVAERPERRIRRHFGAVLHIARRRNRAIPPNPHRSGSIP
ncbi:trans-aconitate 2-methyltransferase [Rhodococcus sp. JVH1]|uniref:class I SAM-dependent methyltransferase n=1 Tax=Rhodococcus sp. JVH1 TaxID=745408 RepID=UPI000271F4CE|nr:class I SAM-dependent methyltransferase [Rhodococcus sp. JVH1]EJI94167.1 cyclopropane-fatty-acyl-phospholipid synthase family protein [Rhodococcus sp. JVH1]